MSCHCYEYNAVREWHQNRALNGSLLLAVIHTYSETELAPWITPNNRIKIQNTRLD